MPSSSSSSVRSLRETNQEDDDSLRARLDDVTAADENSPAVAAASPLDLVQEADSFLPRPAEANAPNFRPTTFIPSGRLITLTHAIPVPETTLRTSIRPTGQLRSSSASRSLLPVATGRPSLSPSQSRATGRPSLGPSGPVGPQSQAPLTSSTQPSLLPATTGVATTTPGVVPILPAPAPTGTSAESLPDQASAQPSVTAIPSSGLDAGSIVGFILLALVGVAALIGSYVFIKKCASKRNNRSGPPSISGPFSDSSAADEAPMVMARSYPDIAAQLGAIAARAEKGELQSTASPPPSSQNAREERGVPSAENRANNVFAGEAPMVMARSYPEIAARLGAIAARAERGEPDPTVSPSPSSQDSAEETDFPFPAERGPVPVAQERPLQTTYLVPPQDRNEWVTVSPGIGPSAPGRGPPLSFYTERSSGYMEMDSPVVPDMPGVVRGYVR